MAERPKGYGMTAEVAEKLAGKYDPELDQLARDWISHVTGEDVQTLGSPRDFQETFKNGVILCKLINEIQPGSVKKYNDSKMAFKMMENIGKFLDACVAYGVPKADLFQTVDLYEGQNIPQVINGIIALGRKAGANGFEPAIGPREATENRREFTDEQMKEGQRVIGLQMGSNKGANQSGMSYGKPRQIHDPTM